VFQTIDIGAGKADYILGQARKFRNRRYGVIDPRYKAGYTTPTYTYNLRELATQLSQGGISVFAGSLAHTLRYMKKNNMKTRHFNIDFPYIETAREVRPTVLQMVRLAKEIPHVLEPNGKIFLTTEVDLWANVSEKIGREYGLVVRKKRVLIGKPPSKTKTLSMQLLRENYPVMTHIWKVVIEYVPRKYHVPK
jgi:hypothetical protein